MITFKFSTDATKGKYIIDFKIPVVGFSTDDSADTHLPGITWIIRGGTEPGQPDFFGDDDTASSKYPNGDPREGVALIAKSDPNTTYNVVVKD